MSSIRLLFALLITLGAALLLSSTEAFAASCPKPAAPSLKRVIGSESATLSWRGPAKAPHDFAGYRIYRGKVTLGQTRAKRFQVRVTPGRVAKFSIKIALRNGHTLACGTSFSRKLLFYPPGSPTNLRVEVVGNGKQSALLKWEAGVTGDGKLLGYRVVKDSVMIGQTKATEMSVPVSALKSYSFSVMAVDSRGTTSPSPPPVTVKIGHDAPSVPGNIVVTNTSNTLVNVSWAPSVVKDGARVTYRLMRDGKLVKNTTETSASVAVAANHTYSFTVIAVDSLGYSSAESGVTGAKTGHNPPSAITGLSATNVTDTTIDLSWSASVAEDGAKVTYHVFRDGKMLGTTTATSFQAKTLAAAQTYSFYVEGSDSLGAAAPTSPTISVQTARPPQASGKLHAFLLASDGQSFRDLQAHYQQVGTIYPTFHDCTSDGVFHGTPDAHLVAWAHLRGLKVVVRYNCQKTQTLHNIITVPSLRQQTIDYFVQSAKDGSYDGVNIDFEAGMATDRNGFSSFVDDLSAALHSASLTVSIDLSAKYQDVLNHPRSSFFDYDRLSASVDTMFVMSWGIHWQTSDPGSGDDINWVAKVVGYVDQRPRREKYVFGFPMYGFNYTANGQSGNIAKAMEYSDIMALVASSGATPQFDPVQQSPYFSYSDNGVPHQVWYQNADALSRRVALVQGHGYGVGVWRLGKEDPGIWSIPGIG